ncbi:MAG: sugar-binding protein [Elusimicrobiota bacterium]
MCKSNCRAITVLKLMFLAIILFTGIAKADESYKPSVTVWQTKSAPKIDGVINDTCWQEVQPITGFCTISGTTTAEVQTTAKLCYDDNNLYFAIVCEDPMASTAVAKAKIQDYDGSVYNDDSIEIFVSSNPDTSVYYHFVVNILNTKYDAKHSGKSDVPAWNADWQSEIRVNDTGWTIEICLPFTGLGILPPVPDNVWALNIARSRYAKEVAELSEWSPTYEGFHNPQHFGVVKFGDKQPVIIDIPAFSDSDIGYNKAKFVATNKNTVNVGLKIVVDTGLGDDINQKSVQTLNLKPNQQLESEAGYGITNPADDTLWFSLYAIKLNNLIYRQRVPLKSMPSYDIVNTCRVMNSLVQKNISDIKTDLEPITKSLDNCESELNRMVEQQNGVSREEWAKTDTAKELAKQCKTIDMSNIVLWTKSPMLKISESALPNSIKDVEIIELYAAQSEYESTVVNITNLSGAQIDARVMVSPLKNVETKEEIQTKDVVTTHEIVFVDTRLNTRESDALPISNQIGRVVIPSQQTQQMWFNYRTHNLKPGVYENEIKVVPFDIKLPTKKVKVKLTVWPFVLPAKMPINVYQWDYAKCSAQVDDLFAHKVNTILVSQPVPIFNDDGTIKTVDFSSNGALNYKKGRGAYLVYSYGILREVNRSIEKNNKWEYMGPEWKRAFKNYVIAFVKYLKTQGIGYNDFAVQLWDEASGENVGNVVKGGAFLREIDPNIITVMDGNQGADQLTAMEPYIDIWIPRIESLEKPGEKSEKILAFYRQQQAKGKPVWCYSCSTNCKTLNPLSYYRLKPWIAWDLKLDGVCYWAYNSWRGDPWNAFDGGMEDAAVIYNIDDYKNDVSPVTSRRWETWRDGLEDYLYLHILKERIQKLEAVKPSQKSELVVQAKQVLDDAVKTVLANKTDPSVVMDYRKKIAEMIVKLQ